MRRSLTAPVLAMTLLAAMLGEATAVAAEPAGADATVRIEAYVDGRSQLILRGDTAQWHHFDYAAPGRWRFADEPTIISGDPWYPSWPDIPDAENRDCNCHSDVFVGVRPPLPSVEFLVELRVIESRFETTVVQHPEASNGYTAVIEFNDNRPEGPAWYIAEFDVPTAGTLIGVLEAEVEHLIDARTLNRGQGRALLTKLDGALDKLCDDKVKQACKRLGVFVKKVRRFETRGVLSPAEAGSLIGKAREVVQLTCRR